MRWEWLRSQRVRWHLWVCASLVFSLAVLRARMLYTGQRWFGFLQWNLFLALLPFFASLALREAHERAPRLARSGVLAPLWLLWLVFWPNAPYLLTDLVHLAPREGLPLWVDLLMLLSFAHNGLLLGFGSLLDVERALSLRYPRARWASITVVTMAIASGSFAIFLGRFMRWNSWDLWLRPRAVLSDIAAVALHPWQHGDAWLFTAAVSGFLLVAYGQFRSRSRPVAQGA